MSGRLRLLAAAVAWVGTAACTSVLGLDAPTLDPCAGQPCLDATSEAAADASAEVGVEASPDTGGGEATLSEAGCVWDGGVRVRRRRRPVRGRLLRRGGLLRSDAGLLPDADERRHRCLRVRGQRERVRGYAIDCVNENDCSGSDVCCHYTSHTVCAQSCTSGADIACLPGSTDDCPTGKKCSVPVTDGDAAAPYYTCQP